MSEFSLSEINDRIAKDSKFVPLLKKAISQVIVGQNELIDKILKQRIKLEQKIDAIMQFPKAYKIKLKLHQKRSV